MASPVTPTQMPPKQPLRRGYYVDDLGRAFESDGLSVEVSYVFGARAIPLRRFPQGRGQGKQIYFKQQREMWERVGHHLNWLDRRVGYLASALGLTSRKDDLYDEALAALMRASVNLRDELNDQKFLAYAGKAVQNSCFQWAKKNRDQLQLVEGFETPTIPVESVPVEMLVQAKNKLSPEDWEALYFWVVERMTLEEIGEKYGVRKSTMSARMQKVKVACRKILMERVA